MAGVGIQQSPVMTWNPLRILVYLSLFPAARNCCGAHQKRIINSELFAGRGLPLVPFKSGAVDAELHQPGVFHFGDVNGFAIRATETEIAGAVPQHVNFLKDRSVGRHLYYGAFAIASDVQVAVDIAAHPVEAVVGELFHQPFVAQRSIRGDRESPDTALNAFVEVQRFAVRADVDPVGGTKGGGHTSDFAGAIDPPDLAGVFVPCGVTGIKCPVGSDGEIIGLIHGGFVSKYGDLTSVGVSDQHVVVDVICDEHSAGLVEANTVAHAAIRQLQENLTFPIRRHSTNRALPREIHSKDVSLQITGGAFDPRSELFFDGERGCFEEGVRRRWLLQRLTVRAWYGVSKA